MNNHAQPPPPEWIEEIEQLQAINDELREQNGRLMDLCRTVIQVIGEDNIEARSPWLLRRLMESGIRMKGEMK